TITARSVCPSATITASASSTTLVKLPDLTITKTKVIPSSIVEEYTRVKISGWIKNIGNGYARNIPVVFFDNGNQINSTKTILSLPPNAQISQYVTFRIEGLGTHTITVIVDPSNTIPEIDETNNSTLS
ncbi:MAG: CARDB domain-containing protein, partial [bacterium]